MKKRIILFTGAIETLEYFSLQLAESLRKLGHEIFIWDLTTPVLSREAFDGWFQEAGSRNTGSNNQNARENTNGRIREDKEVKTAERIVPEELYTVLTFNFIGLSDEGQCKEGEKTLWEVLGIPVVCIMVDSPMYYYKQLMEYRVSFASYMTLVCIDRNHLEFLKEFYPEYQNPRFLPLAGNLLLTPARPAAGSYTMDGPSIITYEEDAFTGIGDTAGMSMPERPIDILFTGNYVAIDHLDPHLAGLDEDVKAFLKDTIQDLLDHPQSPMEEMCLKHIYRDFYELDEGAYLPEIEARHLLPAELTGYRDEILAIMYRMVYVDLYVRSVFRGRIVSSLADAGFHVFCTGKDWELAPCIHKENLLHTGHEITSSECLQYQRKSKICLNVMPWFKAGAHDRIFNAMAQGCVCLTDSSAYLDDILKDGENSFVFFLEQEGSVIQKAKAYLQDAGDVPVRAKNLVNNGHLWQHRAEELSRWIG